MLKQNVYFRYEFRFDKVKKNGFHRTTTVSRNLFEMITSIKRESGEK